MQLGFLRLFGALDDADGLTGAILVSDELGYPQEMRFTERLQTTRMQRALYGSLLGVQGAPKLLVEPLLRALETSPEVIFSNDGSLVHAMPRWPDLPPVAYMGASAPQPPPAGIRLIELRAADDLFVVGVRDIDDSDMAEAAARTAAAHFYPPEIFARVEAAMRVVPDMGRIGE